VRGSEGAGPNEGSTRWPRFGLYFQTPELLLAGWLNHLVFDLFIGALVARVVLARRSDTPTRLRGLPLALSWPDQL